MKSVIKEMTSDETVKKLTDVFPTFKNAQVAFEDAIKSGRLSADKTAANYAGDYMYMGTWDGIDSFKHSDTRAYIG